MKKKGFTLIELLVVIFIVGAFFLVAVPKLKDMTDVNIKSAARNLTGTIKYLYNEAAFKKNIYRLVFDIEGGEYWVEVLQNNEYIAHTDPWLKRRKLPVGVYFRDIITERSDGTRGIGEEQEFILFLPTGYVEPAVIYLETESDKYYTIATKPYTGGTRVYDDYVELLLR